VNELEAHLRDSVSRLRAAGLSEEEAWTAAKRNLGEYEKLEHEFAKINPPVRVWRAATSIMIGIIVATVFFQVDRPFSNHIWWTFSQEWVMSGLLACATIIPAFLLLIVPLFALLRKLKWELPWWSAFGAGVLVCLVVWMLPWFVRGLSETRPLVVTGGFVAWGAAVAVYARFKATPRVAHILSGAWMGVSGAALCGFATWLPQLPQWHSWRDALMGGIIAPFMVTAAWSCFAFPMGAAVGSWMPQRLKEASARKSFTLGLAVGAGVGVLATSLQFLMGEIPILNTKYDPSQLELVQEAFFRETFVMFRNVVPTTALWVGWWAWRWNRCFNVESSTRSTAGSASTAS
jgi:hypothetical protein